MKKRVEAVYSKILRSKTLSNSLCWDFSFVLFHMQSILPLRDQHLNKSSLISFSGNTIQYKNISIFRPKIALRRISIVIYRYIRVIQEEVDIEGGSSIVCFSKKVHTKGIMFYETKIQLFQFLLKYIFLPSDCHYYRNLALHQ